MSQRLELSWKKVPGPYRTENRPCAGSRHVGAIFYGSTVFELVDDQSAQTSVLVPNNRKPVSFPIRGWETAILFDFANIRPVWAGTFAGEPTNERSDLELFAVDYGLLFDAPEVDLSECYRAVAAVWGCLHLISVGRRGELVAAMRGMSIPAGRRRFGIDGQTVVEPSNIMDLCLHQLADLIEKGADIRRCPYLACGRFYEAKDNKKWCSNRCKTAAGAAKTHRSMIESLRGWTARLGEGGMYLSPSRKRAWIDPFEWPLCWEHDYAFDVRNSPVLLDVASKLTKVDEQNKSAQLQRIQYGLTKILTDTAENASFTAIRRHTTPFDLIAA